MLHLGRESGRIRGAQVGIGDLFISYLFFVNDSVLFGEASKVGARAMKAIISYYEHMFSQLVNFDKSLIFFSKNVEDTVSLNIGIIFGVRIANNQEKYLGLLTMVGRRKKRALMEIKEKFLLRIKNRSTRLLLIGGEEVFVKTVLQAIPVYSIQCFRFPITFCRELENLMSKFWWRNSKSGNGIHWYR